MPARPWRVCGLQLCSRCTRQNCYHGESQAPRRLAAKGAWRTLCSDGVGSGAVRGVWNKVLCIGVVWFVAAVEVLRYVGCVVHFGVSDVL